MFDDENSLKINRFYNRVEGVTDTQLFFDQLFIFGSDEIEIVGPAINRQALETYKEYPYIVKSYHLKDFYIINNQSDYFKNTLLGLSDNSITLFNITKTDMFLNC